MSDIQAILAMFFGLFTAGLLLEALRALIWGCVIAFTFRRFGIGITQRGKKGKEPWRTHL